MAEASGIYQERKKVASDTFRDHISTVDQKGKRVWLFPKKPKGSLTNYRSYVSYFLLAILFAAPFIRIDGQPFLLFNIFERKFIIFGQVFWPQDFFLFVIGFITSIVFVILFTVVFGRIFCGWICPQTIFMEGVFRKIEYWIEGDYMAQKKLDKQPWNGEKIKKKFFKQTLFILISILIMHTFMAYLLGVADLWEIIQAGPLENTSAFIAMVVFTGLFYGVFSKMREQVCTTICPYGRLQGVLLDQNSIVVGYDYKRGDNRGRFKKNQDRAALGLGDCIDCNQCALVCPTGIDIRNGTQLECINCTACIDACDSIMAKIGKPKGLIRYTSEKNIAQGQPFRFTARIKAYTTVLSLLVCVLLTLLIIRTDFETTITRTPGMLYQKRDDGQISNLYQLSMVNKTNSPVDVELRLLEPSGNVELVGNALSLESQGKGEGAFFVVIPAENLNKMSEKIQIGVFSGEEQIETIKTRFLGPAK
ncbi:MAG: cytochrome c oxidase accessory protein CcoG [Bacteroidota bacterium]